MAAQPKQAGHSLSKVPLPPVTRLKLLRKMSSVCAKLIPDCVKLKFVYEEYGALAKRATMGPRPSPVVVRLASQPKKVGRRL